MPKATTTGQTAGSNITQTMRWAADAYSKVASMLRDTANQIERSEKVIANELKRSGQMIAGAAMFQSPTRNATTRSRSRPAATATNGGTAPPAQRRRRTAQTRTATSATTTPASTTTGTLTQQVLATIPADGSIVGKSSVLAKFQGKANNAARAINNLVRRGLVRQDGDMLSRATPAAAAA